MASGMATTIARIHTMASMIVMRVDVFSLLIGREMTNSLSILSMASVNILTPAGRKDILSVSSPKGKKMPGQLATTYPYIFY